MARVPKYITDEHNHAWVICHDTEWVPVMSRKDEAYGMYYYRESDPGGPRLLVARDEMPAFDFSTDWIEVPPYPLGDDEMTNSVDKLKQHLVTEAKIKAVLNNEIYKQVKGQGSGYFVINTWKINQVVAGAVSIDVEVGFDSASGIAQRNMNLLLPATDFDKCFQ